MKLIGTWRHSVLLTNHWHWLMAIFNQILLLNQNIKDLENARLQLEVISHKHKK